MFFHCRFTFFLFWVESSSIHNCQALSASVQQILRNSWISSQFLALSSWKALFLIFNSLHRQLLSLWVWSVNLIRLIKFHPLGLELNASFVATMSVFCIFHSRLSNSDCASDNFVWAAHSPWKACMEMMNISRFTQNLSPFHLGTVHTPLASTWFVTSRQRFLEDWLLHLASFSRCSSASGKRMN